MLERDVDNLASYFGRFAPELLTSQYGKEIWALYAHGDLKVDTVLSGRFREETKAVDLKSVMREIEDIKKAEANRLLFKAEAEARPD